MPFLLTGNNQNHFKSLPYPQVPAFIQELRNDRGRLTVQLAFEFLILPATRSSKVLFAKWDEVDLEARVWTIPAKRTKAERAHRVPLAPRCVEILEELRQRSDGRPYVFPGRKAGQPLSVMVFRMVLRRMKRTDCTAHPVDTIRQRTQPGPVLGGKAVNQPSI